jgi:prepilin-type N-terminal cleavage/methylation domain-containing protein
MRSKSQSGFSLIEVLVATVILAVAVSALLANLSTSTSNLFRTNDIDRLNFLSKRKMDELITLQSIPVGINVQGVFGVDDKNKPIMGFSYSILPITGISPNSGERLERVRLETWLLSGSRRRTMQLESFRRVKLQ